MINEEKISPFLSLKLNFFSFYCMIMIVFIHSFNFAFVKSNPLNYVSFFESFISQGVSRVAVPIFYCISGFLFFKEQSFFYDSYLLKLKKRLKTLLVPYFIWSLISLILFFAIKQFQFSSVILLDKQLTKFDLLNILILDPIPYQLWFIRDLFLLCVISPILFFLIKKTKGLIIVFFLFLWFYDFNLVIFRNEALLFFSLGSGLSIFGISLLNKKLAHMSIFFFFIWIFLIVIKIMFFDTIILFHRIAILFGVFSCWFMYDKFYYGIRDIDKKIYSYSFFLFLSHEPLLTFFKKIVSYFNKIISLNELFIYIFAPMLTIVLCILIAAIFKTKLPKLYFLFTGSR